MNCRKARYDIFRERDGRLGSAGQGALMEHVTQCTACRRVRENVAAAMKAWRSEVDSVRVPEANIEWQKVRREIRQEPRPGGSARHSIMKWLALPLAAAALAVALFIVIPSPETGGQAASTAAASGVNDGSAPSETASTVVFVDDKTGWVFVWADDGTKHI